MIVIVCGLPGSGKTTIATGLRDRLVDRGYQVELVHSDDFDRRTYDRMNEHVADAMAESPDDDRIWILDGTFFRREWRNRFYGLGDTYEIWVRASLETCQARNRAREDSIPPAGVGDIAEKFEPPRADLVIDTEEVGIQVATSRAEETTVEWAES